MKYESLKSLYYQNPGNFERVYHSRFDSPEAVRTGLYVFPYDKKRQKRLVQSYEMFYIPNAELSILMETVFQNTQKIERIRLRLPGIAEVQLFTTNLANELQSTNEIEGVRSTRKEINEVIKRINSHDYRNQRFEGLVKQYLNLMNDKPVTLVKLADFRDIWNNLLSKSEVDAVPDGKLFRTEPVFITDGQRNIHEGDHSEGQINQDLMALIRELNNVQIPKLPRYLMAHYFFEYVHPFYDGNGRTGRYILCSFLSQILDPLTAITFSSTIAKKKNSYYKAFMEMSNEHNRAEATRFIMAMLKILRNGQVDLIDAMTEDVAMLKKAQDVLQKYHLSSLALQVANVLCQQAIFGTQYDTVSDKEIVKYLKTTRYKLNQVIEELVDQGLVKKIGASPKIHIISDKLRAHI
ncbi:Fic family protein [Limosilactobacillus sp.]|uniref:Fic family protein n=1 Tax=Limosilactobacillus sp. TaxID=2773925 RepID=UPI00345E237C